MFFCKCLSLWWAYIYTAEHIIIRSKHNKFMPDSNRMGPNESKHTPTVKRLRLRFLPKYNSRQRDYGFNKIQAIFKNRTPLDIPKRRNACHMRSRRNRFWGSTGPRCGTPFSDLEILAWSRVDRGHSMHRLKGNEEIFGSPPPSRSPDLWQVSNNCRCNWELCSLLLSKAVRLFSGMLLQYSAANILCCISNTHKFLFLIFYFSCFQFLW